MIDSLQRAQYLAALGIDQWLRRPATGPSDAPTASPVSAARATPVAALTWTQLRATVSQCKLCSLAQTRTQTVFGVGDMQARWLIIGEAPGAEEDRQGEPFVGAAGQLLDKMLAAIDLPRETVFIANMLKCRPPGNRDPTAAELGSCGPYLQRQIALLAPTIILVVGRIAAQALLNTEVPLGRLRGQVHRVGALNTPVIVTYHPAYLLRSPSEKRKAWDDLKFARRTYEHLIAATQLTVKTE